MNKHKFVKIINRLKEARQLQDNINELMNKARENIENDFMNGASLMINHEDTVIDLLQEIMNDTFDCIPWWIYETDYGSRENMTKIYKVGTGEVLADIKTAEDLYDYLNEGE